MQASVFPNERSVTTVSKRNMIWLAIVIAVALLAWLAIGIVAGLVAAAIVLAVSEIVERRARAERRRTSQDAA